MKSENIDNLTAITLLLSTMMGTGITFMPYAFNSVGYITSWLILSWVSFCTFVSLLCISYVVKNTADANNTLTYTSIGKRVSKYVHYCVNISIFFNCFFSNISFYRFLTDIIVEAFPFFKWQYFRKLVAFMLFPLLLYFCLKKEIVNLKKQSWISTASVSFLALLIVFYSYAFGSQIYNSNPQPYNYDFKYGIPFFMPTMVCQPSMVKIVQQLRNKTWKNIIFLSAMTSLGGLFIYGIVGHCGYKVFGSKINSHIVKEFYTHNSLINVYMRNYTIDRFNLISKLAIYSMMFVLGSGFPLQMVPVTDMFMQFIFKDCKNTRNRTFVTVILCTVCLGFVLIENLRIKLIKRVNGALFSTSVSLIYPFLYYISMRKGRGITCIIPNMIYWVTCLIIIYILSTIVRDLWNNDPQLFN